MNRDEPIGEKKPEKISKLGKKNKSRHMQAEAMKGRIKNSEDEHEREERKEREEK